jgi:hypothetical protein
MTLTAEEIAAFKARGVKAAKEMGEAIDITEVSKNETLPATT